VSAPAQPEAAPDAPATAPAAPATDEESHYVPADVRRSVWGRDGGRCAYVAPNGTRCTARRLIEFHHRVPVRRRGPATAENIELRCKLCCARHNLHYAASGIMPRAAPSPTERADSYAA